MRKRETLTGTMLSLPSSEIAEILSRTGFDWLFIDGEHGNFEIGDLQRILQVTDGAVMSLVRVPLNDEIWVKRALDSGAAGIIVPQVKTAEEAEQAVSFCKYPPDGRRSVGISRAHGYGMDFAGYIKRANDDILVVVQIEHIEAVRNAGTIVEVPGVDAVFVGPYDLSASMGMAGDVEATEVKEAIEKVYEVCMAAGKPAGIFGTSVKAVKPYVDMGFSLVCISIDNLIFTGGVKKLVSEIQKMQG